MSSTEPEQSLRELSFEYRKVIDAFKTRHPKWTEDDHGYNKPGEAILECDLTPLYGTDPTVTVKFDIWNPTNSDATNAVRITATTSHSQKSQTLKGDDLAALPDLVARLNAFNEAFDDVTSIIDDRAD